MFSYRHAFHAGNHGDVLKHIVLLATLKHLLSKDAAVMVVDTHAGAGLYRLDGDYAEQSAEAQTGIHPLVAALRPGRTAPDAAQAAAQTAPPASTELIEQYLDAVAHFNRPGDWRIYPGSPFLAHSLLRESARDRLKLFELHPSDIKALAGNIAQLEAGRQITVTRGDGFEGLAPLLPPPSRRALVLIDPSYEIKTDYGRVPTTLQDSLKRFATGTYAIWYPIIPRAEAHDLPRRLKTMANRAGRPWLHATLAIGQAPAASPVPGEGRARPGLTASGMFLINPPHTLAAALRTTLPVLLSILARGRGQGWLVETSNN